MDTKWLGGMSGRSADMLAYRRTCHPSAEAERREIASCIADALEAITEQQRSVLFAKAYDGCTFTEIAEQMGLAVPTVKTHYLRALKSVRRKLSSAGLFSGEDHELQ